MSHTFSNERGPPTESGSGGGDDFVFEEGTISEYIVGIIRNIYLRLASLVRFKFS